MTQYFLTAAGRKSGPYRLDQLAGRLGPGTLVWHAGLPAWVDPRAIPEILPKLPSDEPSAWATADALPDDPPLLSSRRFGLHKVGLLGRRFVIEDLAGGPDGLVASDDLFAGGASPRHLAKVRLETRFLSGWWTGVYDAEDRLLCRTRVKRRCMQGWWTDAAGANVLRTSGYAGSPSCVTFLDPQARAVGRLVRHSLLEGRYRLEIVDGRALDVRVALLLATCCDLGS